MFCIAVIGVLQEGQAEKGTMRLKGSVAAGGPVAFGRETAASEEGLPDACSLAASSAHCSRH